MTNPAVKQDKFTREDAAAKKIFATLPGDLGDELYALWLECEKNESPEARTVNAIKRIDGKLQALDYTHGVMYPDHYAFSISTGIEYTDADPLLREMMDIIITEMKERYVEFTLEDT
jgi:5'-deoxynucleotidase YfbR-like HD superfamily hydrolase